MSSLKTRTGRHREPTHRLTIRWMLSCLLVTVLIQPAVRAHRHRGHPVDESPLQPEEIEPSGHSLKTTTPSSSFTLLFQPVARRKVSERGNLSLSAYARKNAPKRAVALDDCTLIRRDDNSSGGDCTSEKLEPEDGNTVGSSITTGYSSGSYAEATLALQRIHENKFERSPPSRVLVARWPEWFYPKKCEQPGMSISDQEHCRTRQKLHAIGYSALGVVGLCTLMLLILQCLSCIRRRGAVPHDLKMVMSQQSSSMAPKPRSGVPFKFGLRTDGAFMAEDAGDDLASTKRARNGLGAMTRMDEEAAIGSNEATEPQTSLADSTPSHSFVDPTQTMPGDHPKGQRS